jgi:hypothetical protein
MLKQGLLLTALAGILVAGNVKLDLNAKRINKTTIITKINLMPLYKNLSFQDIIPPTSQRILCVLDLLKVL